MHLSKNHIVNCVKDHIRALAGELTYCSSYGERPTIFCRYDLAVAILEVRNFIPFYMF